MTNLLIRGNALRIPLADESVQCVVTSPPYWGLRDYGTGRWIGGDPECPHVGQGTRANCLCGAVRNDDQLGLEDTPAAFVETMVQVFREARRVLRSDGTCFVNLGDSYGSRPGGSNGGWDGNNKNPDGTARTNRQANGNYVEQVTGLKPKDLCGIPWRVALALQADGWYLRSDIIWAKPNPMPESVTDRPTKSHEYVFLLTKSERYYWDAEAVREKSCIDDTSSGYHRQRRYSDEHQTSRPNGANRVDYGDLKTTAGVLCPEAGRNIRTVWNIPTESYVGAHFATFPRKLAEPCIKAGTSQKGCCPECGKGWVRIVTSESIATRPGRNTKVGGGGALINGNRDPRRKVCVTTDHGWRPACQHGHDPIPCVVLDPFAGSGTTVLVAEGLHRRGIGLDLSAEYLKLASNRINHPHRHVPRPGKAESFPLWGE